MIKGIWDWARRHQGLIFWVYIVLMVVGAAVLLFVLMPMLDEAAEPDLLTLEEVPLDQASDWHFRIPNQPVLGDDGVYEVELEFYRGVRGVTFRGIDEVIASNGSVSGLKLRYTVGE